jgi:hypothetical protein
MQESLNTQVIGFLAPLHDDGAPYSLQPFLQRESTFAVSLAGGHFDTHNPLGGPDPTDWWASLSAGGDLYLERWLAVFASVGYQYDDLSAGPADQATHLFAADVGLGLRARDTRLDLSYAQAASRRQGAFAPLKRGQVQLAVTSAIARRFEANVIATSVPGGGTGELALEYFAAPWAGIFANALAGKGQLYGASDTSVRRYEGSAGFAGWFDATTALSASYRLLIEDVPPNGYHQVAHTISLQVIARMR